MRPKPRSPYACAAVFGIVLSLVALPAPARAQAAQGEDAGSHFERGVKFFRDGDYVAAMVEFKRAYAIDPNYAVLYNIGQTAREQNAYAEALTALERYLQEGGAELPQERRANVERWVAELRERVATVTLRTNVAGADIAVDDVDQGKSPLPGPVVMNAGRRKITATKEGYAPLTRYIEVAGTERPTVALDLVSLSGPIARARGHERAPAPTASGGSAWPWIGVAATGTLGAATGIFGALALSKKGALDDALDAYPTSPGAIEDARGTARAFATTADILGAATILAAGFTVAAFVLDGSENPAGERASVRATVGPGSFGVRGAF